MFKSLFGKKQPSNPPVEAHSNSTVAVRSKKVDTQAIKRFKLDDKNLLVQDGHVPLTYWVVSTNFGDILSK